MRCRFGSKRRRVAAIEWLRLLPKPGLRPQMEQTLDIGRLVRIRGTVQRRTAAWMPCSMRDRGAERARSQAAASATIECR